MKKNTKLLLELKEFTNFDITYHYEDFSLSGATVIIMNEHWKESKEELTRKDITNYLVDWMIARAREYNVD